MTQIKIGRRYGLLWAYCSSVGLKKARWGLLLGFTILLNRFKMVFLGDIIPPLNDESIFTDGLQMSC